MPARNAKSRGARSGIQLPDEKSIKPTDQTLPVQPPKRARKPERPTAAPAVDQRRQIVGTDEPKNRSRPSSR
jgi:hypothetical protein